jgi:hypothetical protein
MRTLHIALAAASLKFQVETTPKVIEALRSGVENQSGEDFSRRKATAIMQQVFYLTDEMYNTNAHLKQLGPYSWSGEIKAADWVRLKGLIEEEPHWKPAPKGISGSELDLYYLNQLRTHEDIKLRNLDITFTLGSGETASSKKQAVYTRIEDLEKQIHSVYDPNEVTKVWFGSMDSWVYSVVNPHSKRSERLAYFDTEKNQGQYY